MNGVINLSILDGWWSEGYDGRNGWAIKPVADPDPARRDREEARALYEILQDAVVPLFYDVGPHGLSPGWVAMAKRSMVSLLPRFNTERMLGQYIEHYYRPAAGQWHRHAQAGFAPTREADAVESCVHEHWSRVRARRLDHSPPRIRFGESLRFELAIDIDGTHLGPTCASSCCSGAPTTQALRTGTNATRCAASAAWTATSGSTRSRSSRACAARSTTASASIRITLC